MAIEYVYMFMNSSIIHDEVFSHRLGLVPINVDPRMFEFIGTGEAENPTEFNTAVFKLDVKNPLHPVNPESLPKGTVFAAGPQRTMNVMSGALEWIPQGDQVERFPNGLAPVYDDILLAKLRPGQEIIAEMHCRKGIGKDHAKYSPVATVSYRLLPKITLKKELRGEEANRLIEKCPMNVFDIEDLGGGEPVAKVARPRDCTMCRECIREVGWGEKVSLERVADHFIFSIESVGALPPKVFFNLYAHVCVCHISRVFLFTVCCISCLCYSLDEFLGDCINVLGDDSGVLQRCYLSQWKCVSTSFFFPSWN
ncbi:unnamed protein product [Choristocarpus tenellus]